MLRRVGDCLNLLGRWIISVISMTPAGRVKLGHLFNYVVLHLIIKLRIDRERQRISRQLLGCREAALPVSKISKAPLPMQWHRILDLASNAGISKMPQKFIAPRTSKCVLVIDVAAMLIGRGSHQEFVQAARGEQLVIARCLRSPGLIPAVEVPQLDTENGCLECIE